MRLFSKRYPALIDVYTQRTVINPETNETVRSWDYENPQTYKCNATSLTPQNSLEQFGAQYSKKLFAKVELDSTDVVLSQRAGNVRSLAGEPYFVMDGAVSVFNISSINRQIDLLGNPVCTELYLEFFDSFSDNIAR